MAPLSKENLSKPPKKGIAAWLGQAIGQTNRCGMLRMNDSYCVVSLCQKLRMGVPSLELVDMTRYQLIPAKPPTKPSLCKA